MSGLIKTDDEYKKWITDVSKRFRQGQLKAAIKVNDEMLRFYWSLGRDMDFRKENYAWGSHFYSQISKDLKKELPEVKSFSPRNLLYMHQFYCLFSDAQIAKQPVSQFGSDSAENMKQTVSELEELQYIFMIPWGHIMMSGSKALRAYFIYKIMYLKASFHTLSCI